MKTYDMAEVLGFVADLDARMVRCQNGEGMECATLDAALRHHAGLCCEFTEGVRQWGREVFAGRVAFDPKVESVWRTEGSRLYAQAMGMRTFGQKAQVPCYELEGHGALLCALWELYRMLRVWVSPRVAAGPSARGGIATDPPVTDEAIRRVDALPPLPADWKPDDAQQQATYRRMQHAH